HRGVEPPALAGALPLQQCGQDGRRHEHAGARIAEARTRLDRRPVGLAGHADGAAGGLRDHVEGQAALVLAPGAEALDLTEDDARVELLHLVVAETKRPEPSERQYL